MYNIIHTSKTGMIASQGKIDIVSNNMVNSQTSGYKKLDIGFLDLYTETLDRKSYPNNSEDAIIGTGVKVSQATRNLQQGSIKNTGIKTDLAIDGEGYFRVIGADGNTRYTRDGEFNIDSNGQLVDDYGNILDIDYVDNLNSQNVNFSSGELSINKVGEVFVNNEKIGNVNLYTVQGDNDLIPEGENLFSLREGAQISLVQNPNMLQGHIEMSNVNMQNEMTDLIMSQRAFQFNSRAINAVDEMWNIVNNLQAR